MPHWQSTPRQLDLLPTLADASQAANKIRTLSVTAPTNKSAHLEVLAYFEWVEATGLIGSLITRSQWQNDVVDRFSNRDLISRYLAARMAGSRGHGPVGVVTLRGTLYRLSSWVRQKYGLRLHTLSPALYKKQLKGALKMRLKDPKENQKLPLTWEILILPRPPPPAPPGQCGTKSYNRAAPSSSDTCSRSPSPSAQA